MRITVVGKGNVGGGLAVPGGAIAEALEKVGGIEGKTVIDATNLYGVVPPAGFASNAEFVKSKTNGPTAKAFNINFASLYPELSKARARPSNLWCGDAEAREAVEQLNRDAGYDPVWAGPIGITAGPDGNLWFTEMVAGKVGRITTAGVVTEFPVTTESS